MISDFLKELREKGITQEAIAETLGIKQSSVSKLFNGGNAKISTIIKLADIYEVTTDHVLGRDKKEK